MGIEPEESRSSMFERDLLDSVLGHTTPPEPEPIPPPQLEPTDTPKDP